MDSKQPTGPLAGLRVIEIAGIGPGPFCAMMLSDMGAEVIRIDRAAPPDQGIDIPVLGNVTNRGRRSAVLDLKSPEGVVALKRLVAQADALIEGFRPGVMERLGLGPDELLAVNPRLVYGRITGWGQEGPLAKAAGHDLNYIALSGMLHAIGPADRPLPPLNLIGDYGGGAMYLAFGMVCALLERAKSGKGQVVDAAMVDGAASLGAALYGLLDAGLWHDRRASNLLDGGVPWYDSYGTSDGKHIAIGPLEPRFYDRMLELLGVTDDTLRATLRDRSEANWPRLREAFAEVFRTRTRDEWCARLEGTDVCFAPVLSMAEAPHHPHTVAREGFVAVGGVVQPAPAPRFSRSRPAVQGPPPAPGEHTRDILADWGFTPEEVDRLSPRG
ncbi:CaiB/BaiF CoA transferase family protein [Azospirillum agricola]|uniref:CaiB/BaiF CoA transferase family protein n=1 Tax=Azospirillum agricola TaxID=1720247 RepID=UPI000A0F0915|nr:CaiB/BaiF CoA-transferase family protein [Azospirillum agricola]SMH37181.1 alpha-methylacyl-CoA racemase [Azospirillum lipoferum]